VNSDSDVRGFVRGSVAAVIGLMALAAVIRIPTLGGQSFLRDEVFTLRLVHMSAGKMLATIPHSESNPPLYYLVEWVWARIAGYSEAGLRSLSVVCGILTVPVVYRAGAVLVSRRAGLVAGLTVAVSPFLVWYSQEARAYALLILLASWSFLMFVHSLRSPTPRNLGLWSLASALALTAHYFAIFLVVAEAAWLLTTSAGKRIVAIACIPWAATTLALLPLALYQRAHINTGWIAASGSLPVRFKDSVKSFLSGVYLVHPPLNPWTALVPGLLVLTSVALLLRPTARNERRRVLPCVVVGLIAVGTPTILDVAGLRYVEARNLSVCLIPLLVPVAAGFTTIRAGGEPTRVGTAALVGLCLVWIGLVVNVYVNPRYQKADWREVGRQLGPAPVPRALVAQRSPTLRLLRVYLPQVARMPRGGTEVKQIAVVDATVNTQGPPALPRFRPVARHRTDTTSVYVYSARRPVKVTRSALRAHRLEPGPFTWVGLQLPPQ